MILYFGPRLNKDPRWVPAIVVKKHGTRSVHARVIPKGPDVTSINYDQGTQPSRTKSLGSVESRK